MSLAGSKAAHSTGPDAVTAVHSSAGSTHQSERGRASQVSWKEAAASITKSAARSSVASGHQSRRDGTSHVSAKEAAGPSAKSVASSIERSNHGEEEFPTPEVHPPESVASFAGPDVDPSDSVSQIGSRRSRSANRSLSRRRSRSLTARSQASSSRLTKANLEAHDAEPRMSSSGASQAEHKSHAGTEHTARPSRRGQDHRADEESEAKSSAHQSLPSKASTAKPLQSNAGRDSHEMTGAQNAGQSQAGSKAGSAALSHSGSRASNARSSHTGSLHAGSHVSIPQRSHVGSKVQSVVLSQHGSVAHRGPHSHSGSITGASDHPRSVVSRASVPPSEHRSRVVSEVHPLAESITPDQLPAPSVHSRSPSILNDRVEGSTAGSGTQRSIAILAARSTTTSSPPASDSHTQPHQRHVDIVLVEREDEQLNETDYKIQRRHEYHVHH